MPSLQIPEKLKPLLRPKQIKVIYGGRGSGKSQTIADLMLMLVETGTHRVGCFRELQNSIKDSVHSLLCSEYSRLELGLYSHTDTGIRHAHGGEFIFKGISRNPDAVKSTHGMTRAWVEEAQSVSHDSLQQLIPTVRAAGSELWFSMNPMSSEDPMSQRFLKPFEAELARDGYYEDDMHMIIQCNYMDNPFFPPELEALRRWDHENLSRSEYDHIWLGHYNDHIEGSLIKAEWFDSCIDAHVKLGFKAEGARIAAHDPSDTGSDSKGYVFRHGSVVLDVQEMTTGGINEGGHWAAGLAIQSNADYYTWDCDGMGVGLTEQTDKAFRGKRTSVVMFKGSESPDNASAIYQPVAGSVIGAKTIGDVFRNKRAQYYFEMADRMHRTHRAVTKGEYCDPDKMISLSSSIDVLPKLRAEVCRIPVKPNGNGFLSLYTKDEMKSKFKIASPNLADSLMMSCRYITTSKPAVIMPRKIGRMGIR